MKRLAKHEIRTAEQIREHYITEKKLAGRLRTADKEERKTLYTTVYDELYTRISHHPQLARKTNTKAQDRSIARKMKFLSKFLKQDAIFLELGPGDCRLSFEVARYVKKVYAIDASKIITKNIQQPPNFELLLSSDPAVNCFSENIDIVYSNQLMEHLHPDDAVEQLQDIYKALVQGGIYICITPHRFSGPHDISRYFDNVATGFHLKEYTNRELYCLLKAIGFSKIQSYLNVNIMYIKLPIKPLIMIEDLLNLLPDGLKRNISNSLLLRKLLGICLVATK